ncbi:MULTISPECIES: DUF2239 family protein [Kaistia]|uniref:DUF2239 family protein n=1 Tax=Kaistia nematophila TaxID=2994654 RepID=A0A9X3E5C4_9HYPH|nr:DUF2239 family protein [Kaistia nematophila]MCX5571647.1 DUF2239 family protein [Kaistia nematophila]
MMSIPQQVYCTAFQGLRRIASGLLPDVALKSKEAVDQGGEPVLLFDDDTSRLIEVDFRGSAGEVLARLTDDRPVAPKAPVETAPPRGPGRPKLGVVAREVTLLPRHWEWLGSQPGGASVALRKLVDEARRSGEGRDRARRAQEATQRFMTAMAGDQPGYEEASRALFAGDRERFRQMTAAWPVDIRDHAGKLAGPAFEDA